MIQHVAFSCGNRLDATCAPKSPLTKAITSDRVDNKFRNSWLWSRSFLVCEPAIASQRFPFRLYSLFPKNDHQSVIKFHEVLGTWLPCTFCRFEHAGARLNAHRCNLDLILMIRPWIHGFLLEAASYPLRLSMISMNPAGDVHSRNFCPFPLLPYRQRAQHGHHGPLKFTESAQQGWQIEI